MCKLLSRAECAGLLNVSLTTLDKIRLRDGKLTYVKVRGQVRIRWTDFVLGHRRGA